MTTEGQCHSGQRKVGEQKKPVPEQDARHRPLRGRGHSRDICNGIDGKSPRWTSRWTQCQRVSPLHKSLGPQVDPYKKSRTGNLARAVYILRIAPQLRSHCNRGSPTGPALPIAAMLSKNAASQCPSFSIPTPRRSEQQPGSVLPSTFVSASHDDGQAHRSPTEKTTDCRLRLDLATPLAGFDSPPKYL